MNETGFHRFQQGQSRYIHQTRPESKSVLSTINSQRDENGFTLVELLIVVTILPLIIGALSLGIISVFRSSRASPIESRYRRRPDGVGGLLQRRSGCGLLDH